MQAVWIQSQKKLWSIAEWMFKMLTSIRSQDQQGIDPAKQTGTERIADDIC